MRYFTSPTLRVSILALAFAAMFPISSVLAQSRPSSDPRDQEIELLKSEVKRLEQRVDTLEALDKKVSVIDQKLDVQAKVEQQKALQAPIIRAGNEGFSFSSPDKDYIVKFGGVIQGDGRFFTSGNDKNVGSTFYLNKARPILYATLFKWYDFDIMPDFGQGKVVLQDAYSNVTYFPQAQFQAGKYKGPLDLERLQADPYTEFSQRSEIQNLVPNRDTGAELHGDLFDKRLSYQLALMNGVPNNTATVDIDNNDGKDFVGRAFATPFSTSENKWAKGLGFGFGASLGDERGSTTSVYKTYRQSTYFSYTKGVTAAGQRVRLEPQAYYYWKGLGLMGEWASDMHELNRDTKVKKGPKSTFVNAYDTFTDTGWMVQASYFLTGEKASYGRVNPDHPFDPRTGHWGAWELAGRFSNIATDSGQFKLGFVDPTVSAKTANEYALGINWYLSDNVKWQFDYARTYFDGGAGVKGAVKDRPDESVFESQLQIAF